MDAIDREILGALRDNARISFRELGDRVGLSANATADRVRRLEQRGVIAGYTALVDPAATGRRLLALVDVRLSGPDASERFEALVRALDAVTDAAHVTGRFDYAVRVACAGTSELDAVIRRLKTDGGVAQTETRIVLQTIVSRSPDG